MSSPRCDTSSTQPVMHQRIMPGEVRSHLCAFKLLKLHCRQKCYLELDTADIFRVRSPTGQQFKGMSADSQTWPHYKLQRKESRLYYAVVVWHEYTWPTPVFLWEYHFYSDSTYVRSWLYIFFSVNLRLIKAAETSPLLLKHILTRHSAHNCFLEEFLQLRSFNSLYNWIIT